MLSVVVSTYAGLSMRICFFLTWTAVPSQLIPQRVRLAGFSSTVCSCLQRLEWVRVKEPEADEAKAARESMSMATILIDCHDFSVVRTINLDDLEDAVAPGTPVLEKLSILVNETGDLPGAQLSTTWTD
jgi:hypothetical protein